MMSPDLFKRAIMQDCTGKEATLNLVAITLNQTGYVQRHCGLFNTQEKARNTRNALQLSQSMATISNEQSTEAAKHKMEKQLEYRALAPVALDRLQTKNDDLNKITKKEIPSIMLSVFLVLDDNTIKKDLLMGPFVKCYEKSRTKIPFLVWRTAMMSQSIPTATTDTSMSLAAR
jgi:hypothetical protein